MRRGRRRKPGGCDEARTIYERAIAASPDSPFLYRELAVVERRRATSTRRSRTRRKRRELSPSEPRNFVALGEIYEAQGDFAKAAEAYGTAVALEPSDALDAKLDDAAREGGIRRDAGGVPRSIETSPTVTRGAARGALRRAARDLLKRARRSNAVVMTDTRGNWAAPWILSVTRAGVMERVSEPHLPAGGSRSGAATWRSRPRAARWRSSPPTTAPGGRAGGTRGAQFADLSPGASQLSGGVGRGAGRRHDAARTARFSCPGR